LNAYESAIMAAGGKEEINYVKKICSGMMNSFDF
jgi:hypothetical protein